MIHEIGVWLETNGDCVGALLPRQQNTNAAIYAATATESGGCTCNDPERRGLLFAPNGIAGAVVPILQTSMATRHIASVFNHAARLISPRLRCRISACCKCGRIVYQVVGIHASICEVFYFLV